MEECRHSQEKKPEHKGNDPPLAGMCFLMLCSEAIIEAFSPFRPEDWYICRASTRLGENVGQLAAFGDRS
jgi:hypothetical protein